MKKKKNNRFGDKVVRLVNRHWLFFGVFSEPPLGMMLGFFIGHSAKDQQWFLFSISIILTVLWIIALFMKSYTDKQNRM